MRKVGLFILGLCLCGAVMGQQSRTFSENYRSLQLSVNGDPLLPPVLTKGKGQRIRIEFDEMSHDYHRLIYHIQHCNADWTPNEDLFESDYLSGFNDRPIEDYENSFNTTQLYTHYSLSFPNEDTQLLLSGNYRVTIYEDDSSPDEPLLQAEFCVVEPTMSVFATVSGNTAIDFNQSHQQVTLSVNYGANRVVDPHRELQTVVVQNRRADRRVTGLRPNIQNASGVEYTHQRALIFPAGNEYHKFELLDVEKAGLNIDRIRWHEPYYHVTLFADTPARNYLFDKDQNGGFVMRNDNDTGDDAITSEYAWFHFILQVPEFVAGGDLYLLGQWAPTVYNEACRLTWNAEAHQYEAALYLKQGYYNYTYVQKTENENAEGYAPDGNFYQTENEYLVFVYHRPQGGRYDRLVGYSRVHSAP